MEKMKTAKQWQEWYDSLDSDLILLEMEEEEKRKAEQLRIENERRAQRELFSTRTDDDIWNSIEVSDDGAEDEFSRMYANGTQPYEVKVHEPVSAQPIIKKTNWLDEDSDEESDDDLFQTGIFRKRENVFEKKETPEEKQRKKEEEKARREEQQKKAEQRLAEERRQQEREIEAQEREAAQKVKEKQRFMEQSVLETTAKFTLLSEEQRNSLGKIQRNSYDKKKEAWEKNVAEQRKVAEKMYALKEQADTLYQKLKYSEIDYLDNEAMQRFFGNMTLPSQIKKVEDFAPAQNGLLMTGEVDLYCDDMLRLSEHNKKITEQLEKVNQEYLQLKEELQQLKKQQGFPVSRKKKASGQDFLGNLDKVNSYLRDDKGIAEPLDPVLAEGVHLTAMHTRLIGKQMVVHKSISQKEWAEMMGTNAQETKIGTDHSYKHFKDKGFCRASFAEEGANDVQLVIAVNKNAAAIRISGAENGGREGILLPQNTEYYVVKEEQIFVNGQLKTRVYLSVGMI